LLTPCLAPPCRLLGPKSEWHQKWDEFIHWEHDCGPLCPNEVPGHTVTTYHCCSSQVSSKVLHSV
jgi:hypothetical protein